MTVTEAQLKRYQTLLNSIRDGIHVLDSQGDVVEVNDAFCEMLGYTQDEAKELNIADWNAQYSKEELLARLKNFVGKRARFETVHRRKDGSHINVEVSTSAIDIDGQTYFFASSRDITERKKAEQNLLITQFVSDHAPDSIFWIDEQARIAYVNESAYRERGYAKEELLGKFITDIDPGSRIDRWPDHWLQLKQKGNLTFISSHRRKDGSTFPIEISANFVKFEGREFNVSFCRDITERKISEDLIKRHTMVINNTHEGFWAVDLNGNLLEVNKAYADMSGYSAEELVKMHITQLDAMDDEQIVQARIKEILDRGFALFETKHRHKDGHLFDVEVSISYLDELKQFFAFFRDITERKAIETRTKMNLEQQAILRELLEMSIAAQPLEETLAKCLDRLLAVSWLTMLPKGGIFVIEEDGQHLKLLVSHRLSAQIQSLCARVPLGLCHCGRAAASAEIQYAQCVDARHEITFPGIEDHGHYNLPLISNNEVLGVLVLYLPVNFQREPLKEQFIGSVADILAGLISRKNAEQALLMHQTHLEELVETRTIDLSNAKEAAEVANLAKSTFLSRMSHELRTPLNAILGFGQMLDMETDLSPSDKQESIRHIVTSGQQLLELINDLLDFAQIDIGNMHLNILPLCIADLTSSCVAQVEAAMASQKTFDIENKITDTSLIVQGDNQRVRQALINLLTNAVKYNRENGRITVSCRIVNAGRLRIEVRDNGLGIASDKLPLLFTPFERIEQKHGTIPGVGIGLHITKQLVEAMHGTVGVESVLGQGSTFWFELPLAEATQEPGLAAEKTGQPMPHGDVRLVVLYIEDNPVNLKLMQAALRNRPGVILLTAGTAEEGLIVAKENLPDLILMDIQLPGIDGITATTLLKATDATRDIPVVALSADARKEDIDRALRSGCSAYLTKPIDLQALYRLIDRRH